MKKTLVLGFLCIVLSLGFAQEFDLPRVVSICKDGQHFNVVRGNAQEAGCLQIEIEKDWIPFIVKNLWESQLPNDHKVISLPLIPSYKVVLSHKSNLKDLETQLLHHEKQLLTIPQLKKIPFENLPKFKKNAEKDDIIASLDENEYYSELEKITGVKEFNVEGKNYLITTRYTHTEDNNDVSAYFLQRFTELGFDSFYQTFTYSGSATQNIIGVKRGTTLADEIIVVGAHMDSTSPSRDDAPGCIDNGSGTEGVLLMAKAFANVTTDRTIHFILFGAEEQGLVGSNYYVAQMDSNNYNVVYSLVMDMIGYSNQYTGVKIETSSSTPNRVLADLMQSNTEEYSPELTIARSTNYFGSDHVPFINSGIPCFLAIEQDDTNYPGYHRTTDEINYLSVEQSMGILKGMTGTLYDISFE